MDATGIKRIGIILLWIANIFVGIMTLLSGYSGIIDPSISVIPAILTMTFPWWLRASIALLAVSLFVKRKIFLFQLLVLLASISPILNYCPLNFTHHSAEDYPQDKTFTLMSYNVFSLIDTQRDSTFYKSNVWREALEAGEVNPTISYILRQNPDLLTLQELSRIGEIKSRLFTWAQVDSLIEKLPYDTLCPMGGVLSRYPLTPIELRQPFSERQSYCGGIADIQGHPTLVISVHLQSIQLLPDDRRLYNDLTEGEGEHNIREVKQQLLSKLSNAFRKRAVEARLLREQIDSLNVENVIIAGDFNDINGCYAMREICGNDFRNAFDEAGFGPVITYNADRFYFHIDHILYRGKMKAVEFRRGDCPNSDHYPVMATFVWED